MIPKIIEDFMPQTAEALSNALNVSIAAATRCYICERRLGESWCVITDKTLSKPMYVMGQAHRCHYTCAFEWMQRHAKD